MVRASGVLAAALALPLAAVAQVAHIPGDEGRVRMESASPAAVGDTLVMRVLLSPSSHTPVASLTLRVHWDTTDLRWLRSAPGSWLDESGQPAMVLLNDRLSGTGSIIISGYTVGGVSGSVTVRQLMFLPLRSGHIRLRSVIDAAGTADGAFVKLGAEDAIVSVDSTGNASRSTGQPSNVGRSDPSVALSHFSRNR